MPALQQVYCYTKYSAADIYNTIFFDGYFKGGIVMKFEDDDVLLARYHEGDDSVFEILSSKYRPLMVKYTQKYYIPLMDFDDMMQECRIIMFKALQRYRMDGKASFITFYVLLLNNHFCQTIRKYSAYKRTGENILGTEKSLDYTDLANYAGVAYAQTMDPADVIEVREDFFQAYDTLSKNEKVTFYQVQTDHTLMDKQDVKQVIYRSQHKLRKALKHRLE